MVETSKQGCEKLFTSVETSMQGCEKLFTTAETASQACMELSASVKASFSYKQVELLLKNSELLINYEELNFGHGFNPESALGFID